MIWEEKEIAPLILLAGIAVLYFIPTKTKQRMGAAGLSLAAMIVAKHLNFEVWDRYAPGVAIFIGVYNILPQSK